LTGGSWNNEPENLRVANRNRNEPDNRNNNLGFRCVRDVERGRPRSRGRSRGDQGRRGRASLHFRTALPTREAVSSASNITGVPASW
jgi:hypothetical protein